MTHRKFLQYLKAVRLPLLPICTSLLEAPRTFRPFYISVLISFRPLLATCPVYYAISMWDVYMIRLLRVALRFDREQVAGAWNLSREVPLGRRVCTRNFSAWITVQELLVLYVRDCRIWSNLEKKIPLEKVKCMRVS